MLHVNLGRVMPALLTRSVLHFALDEFDCREFEAKAAQNGWQVTTIEPRDALPPGEIWVVRADDWSFWERDEQIARLTERLVLPALVIAYGFSLTPEQRQLLENAGITVVTRVTEAVNALSLSPKACRVS